MRSLFMDDTTHLYTIGHSNHSLNEFIELLLQSKIRCLMDVQAFPRSRHNPRFSAEPLRQRLQLEEIVYHWAGKALGGLREPAVSSRHVALQKDGFRAYAHHIETAEFARSIKQLIHLAEQSRTVIMCAEKIPENSHRSLIADSLILFGVFVDHLVASDES